MEEDTPAPPSLPGPGRTARLLFFAAAGIFGLLLLALWLGPLLRDSPGAAAYRRILGEAESLGLTYGAVLSDPAAAAGKPVLWCVQNRGEASVTESGDPGRRLRVVNHPAMPVFTGGKHGPCAEMILTVRGVAGGAVEVNFEYTRNI